MSSAPAQATAHTPLEDLEHAINCSPSDGPLPWMAWRDHVVEAARAVILDAAATATDAPPDHEPIPVEPSIQAQRDAAWERIAARLERIAAEVQALQDEAARARKGAADG